MVGKLFGHPVHQDAAFNRNRRCRFFYMLGGLALLITRRLWGTVLSLVFIGAEVLGRVYLLQTGAAPRSGADSLRTAVRRLDSLMKDAGFTMGIGDATE
jgi:hypothetical protein